MTKEADLPGADIAASWRKERAGPGLVHLDAAGCSLMSASVVAAQAAYLDSEGRIGAYETEAEAAPIFRALHRRIADLAGMETRDVALVANATHGFATLISAWPFPARARIGVLPSEYESNAIALRTLAQRRELHLITLPVDGFGHVLIDGLEEELEQGLDFVTFPHIPSHRGIVQPARAAARACRAAGVPLVLDVAQSAGQVDLVDVGATAYVGTSRKWLRGPRGVGFVLVAGSWADRLTPPLPVPHMDGPHPAAARLEVSESAMSPRVGLAAALDELVAAGIDAVTARIAALGRTARAELDGVGGWEVLDPVDEPCGIVTLRHGDLDPADVVERLAGKGIVTGSVPTTRAPRDLGEPVLRASLHAYCGHEDIVRLAHALATQF